MNVLELLKEIQFVQISLIFYLDDESHAENKFENLIKYFNQIKIYSDKHKLKLVLHLICKISDNHHRKLYFFNKIERVLLQFKDNIKQFFTNSNIFNIFKSNKRILLFLIEEGILVINENIVQKILIDKYINARYHQYFAPEIKPFINDQLIKEYRNNIKNDKDHTNDWIDELFEELPNDFYQKRKIGENDTYICQLIQKDSVEEFIAYVNKTNCSLESIINTSVYETNLFLIRNNFENAKKDSYHLSKNEYKKEVKISLIEYAAFFGAIQIFNYLKFNNVNLPSSLWSYVVHSDCPELIHILEENISNIETIQKYDYFVYCHEVFDKKQAYETIFNESIKCHHFDISNYIKNNFFDNIKKQINKSISKILKNYNFYFIPKDLKINNSVFYYFSKYDYYYFVENQLKIGDININDKIEFTDEEITPLCISIEKENIEIAKLFIQNNKIDINMQSQIKINDRNEQKIDYLINYEHRKNEMITGYYHEWDDYDACKSNNEFIYKTVSPLQLSIEKENIELIKLILSSNKLDINDYNEYSKIETKFACDLDRVLMPSFYYAVLKGNIEIIMILLENKNINHKLISIYENKNDDSNNQIFRTERTALHHAVEKGNIDVVNILLKSGLYDINFPKIYFNYDDDHEEWRLEVEKIERTPLQIAIIKRNIEMIKLLLNNEMINVNELQKYFYSEIFVYSGKQYCDIITNGTNFNSCYRWENLSEDQCPNKTEMIKNQTALHIAIQMKNIEIVKLLLEYKKIDVNIQSYCNIYKYDNYKFDNYCEKRELIVKKTSLYYAIEEESVELVKLLLDNEGIDVNLSSYFFTPDKSKYIDIGNNDNKDDYQDETEVEMSPLHYAVKKGNKKIIILLLNNKNVDVNLKDKQGKTPVELTNDRSIIELFDEKIQK